MINTMWRAGVALAIAAAMAGCAPEDRGGGGGTNTVQDQAQGADQGRDTMAADEQRGYEDRATAGEKLRANLTTDLTGAARDYAEAYARAPWVHANLAAGDWERADDDLQFISDQIADLRQDNAVSTAVKGKIAAITPLITQLDGQIGKKDTRAMHTASVLVSRMGQVIADKQVMAWFGAHPMGGGAGK